MDVRRAYPEKMTASHVSYYSVFKQITRKTTYLLDRLPNRLKQQLQGCCTLRSRGTLFRHGYWASLIYSSRRDSRTNFLWRFLTKKTGEAPRLRPDAHRRPRVFAAVSQYRHHSRHFRPRFVTVLAELALVEFCAGD